jgi:hypothetical protein
VELVFIIFIESRKDFVVIDARKLPFIAWLLFTVGPYRESRYVTVRDKEKHLEVGLCALAWMLFLSIACSPVSFVIKRHGTRARIALIVALLAAWAGAHVYYWQELVTVFPKGPGAFVQNLINLEVHPLVARCLFIMVLSELVVLSGACALMVGGGIVYGLLIAVPYAFKILPSKVAVWALDFIRYVEDRTVDTACAIERGVTKTGVDSVGKLVIERAKAAHQGVCPKVRLK